ncbi:DegT/DnrJ/EryC1/StrS family aminotransferase [Ferruginibacter albus]|uniref:DegT/DnrJ/EryC1/StrS family aminotransferase n=1 Tax=Ferruginibacter albus TaxID=2875540 RepID=UPI001CC42D63|nr:DegT/DnrJ/EryC1/StrS aminotransferase family protein [Ferruginibacter albus]UAY52237.1 DegT/DnrJ/EryC1/StrS aminotransferase family protein [Ferruginibacter albus]
MEKKIPIYQPTLNGNEKKYVLDCLDSTWISSKGKYISLFEEAFAKKIGIKYAASVSNGTTAMHLALLALGIGPGDEVIVPTLTYIASVNCIVYTGATPVFADSLRDTWQLDPESVKRKITSKTKAIIAVHLYGHPCNMDALQKICKEHNLFLIEDCAEAFGSLYKNKYTGTFGDIAAFSFFGNKTISTGEGGMIVTNDATLFDRSVHYKGQGLAKHRQYWHDVIGYNYRMTNICAAIGLAQLEQADTFIEKKLQIATWYLDALKDTAYECHLQGADIKHTYWMFSILVQESSQRDKLREHLEKNGIETRPLFYPVHTMPMYEKKYQRYEVAEDLGWRGINLPSYPGLTQKDILFITDCIKSF